MGYCRILFLGQYRGHPRVPGGGRSAQGPVRPGKLPRWGARLLYLALDSFATALGLAVVDLFLESVSATDASLWVAGLLLALPEMKEIGRKAG